MEKKIIVDIDNTLWDLAPVLWERLRRFNPGTPPPSGWVDWNFWEAFVPLRDLYMVLREIHSRQDLYNPYPESKSFLDALKERRFHITIASHREKGTMEATVRWLKKYELRFDEIHLLHDKSILFDHHFAIVDDSPVTLKKAAEAGIVRVGLRNPWNEHTDHPLFDNLGEILAYIDEQWARVDFGEKGLDPADPA